MRLGLLNCGGTITERYHPDGTLDRLGAHDRASLASSTAISDLTGPQWTFDAWALANGTA